MDDGVAISLMDQETQYRESPGTEPLIVRFERSLTLSRFEYINGGVVKNLFSRMRQ